MTDISTEIKKRRERHQQLEVSHARLAAQVEAIQADRKRAGEEAKNKFGVSTFAELTQKRADLEQQNAEALAKYDQEIAAFEQSLGEVQTMISGMGV